MMNDQERAESGRMVLEFERLEAADEHRSNVGRQQQCWQTEAMRAENV